MWGNGRGDYSMGLRPDGDHLGQSGIGSLPPGDLLVIDEPGPLEFVRGEGLLAGLQVLDAGRYGVVVVVIRPSLLPEAQARWPHAQVITPQI